MDKKFQMNPICCRNLVSFGYFSDVTLDLCTCQITTRKSASVRNQSPSFDFELRFSKPLHDGVSSFQHTSSCPRYPTNLFDESLLFLMYGIGSDTITASAVIRFHLLRQENRQERDMSVKVLLMSVVKLTGIAEVFYKGPVWLQVFIQTTQETHLVPLVQSIRLGLQRMMSCIRCSGSDGIKTCGHARPLW